MWAYVQRDDSAPVVAIAILAVGNVVTLGAGTVLAVWAERGRGLLPASAESDASPRLPQTSFAAAAAGVGAVDLLAAALATGWLGVLGVLLVAAAALAAAQVLSRDEMPDVATARAARTLATFRDDHGGGRLQLAIERTGDWHRLVAVAGDGAYGDFVVRRADQARAAANLAGAEVVGQTDAGVFGHLRTGPYEWRRMAGSQLRS